MSFFQRRKKPKWTGAVKDFMEEMKSGLVIE